MVDDMVEKKTNTTKRSTGDSRPRKTRKQLLAERRSKRTDLGTFRDVMTVPQVAGETQLVVWKKLAGRFILAILK
jgi:hypothetical protein